MREEDEQQSDLELTSLHNLQRTHYAGTIKKEDAGKDVCIMGWVQRKRSVANALFILIRDRSGLVQVSFSKDNTLLYEKANQLRSEYVVAIQGKVTLRPQGMENSSMPTGSIEIIPNECILLNTAKTPPFVIEDRCNASEELRLTHRYLDLRRPIMTSIMLMRSHVMQAVRSFFVEHGFIELETPFLNKATPEGARDFLVPSRMHAGKFYSLPQSPQQFKQLFMMGGLDKYFQIVRCFRDEDLRADRQPEFTQIDVECSFVNEADIQSLAEQMIARVIQEVTNTTITLPLPRITYREAMLRYGVDKPDTRYGMELILCTEAFTSSTLEAFSKAPCIKAFCAEVSFSRKELDICTDVVKQYGAHALGVIKVTQNGLESPLFKHCPEAQAILEQQIHTQEGNTIFVLAGEESIVNAGLGNLRVHVANTKGLIPPDSYNLLWVTEFPLFEEDKETKALTACHHPFTAVHPEDTALLETEPKKARARAYDLVLNGTEIGGGSIRNHTLSMQKCVFQAIGFSEEAAYAEFGYFLDALEYGTPPHGGIAFGFDRILSILLGVDSIRDVIPFPKTQKGSCLLTSAPSELCEEQLQEVHLCINFDNKREAE